MTDLGRCSGVTALAETISARERPRHTDQHREAGGGRRHRQPAVVRRAGAAADAPCLHLLLPHRPRRRRHRRADRRSPAQVDRTRTPSI